jgi:hypothetical protein
MAKEHESKSSKDKMAAENMAAEITRARHANFLEQNCSSKLKISSNERGNRQGLLVHACFFSVCRLDLLSMLPTRLGLECTT